MKPKGNGHKGKKRKVDELEDEDKNLIMDALREKESGIEDEAVERFTGGGKDRLDQVCGDHSLHHTSH